MLSIKRCRELIGANEEIADQEIERLRDQLYGLAAVVTDKLLAESDTRQKNNHVAAQRGHSYEYIIALNMLTEDEQDDVDERAAIIEFEGNADRDTAERQAILAAFRRAGPKKDKN